MMLNHMRDPSKVGIPGIATGLVELCEYLKANLSIVDGRIGTMYELGTFAGEAAYVFAQYFNAVHAVDPWENACGAPEGLQAVIDSFNERAQKAGNIIAHKMTASEACLSVPYESLDFAYVDSGPHEYHGNMREIREWWPKVRRGGFLGGHDYEIPELHAVDVFPGVAQSVGDFFGHHPEEFGLKVFPDTSWIVRRP
jgi:hypothetical protein